MIEERRTVIPEQANGCQLHPLPYLILHIIGIGVEITYRREIDAVNWQQLYLLLCL